MEAAAHLGSLELRRSGGGDVRLRGRFPYGKRAVLGAGGNGRRPKKEEFAPRAFSYAIEESREVHFLLGHSFDRPLASRKSGTLTLEDTDEALTFSALLTPEIQRASWVQDFLAGLAAGLIIGISPGFRIPPPEAVADAEETVEEDPAEGNALIRIIRAAVLFEISAVSRPAYDETELEEARSHLLCQEIGNPARLHPSYRWRA
ncbi:MAG: HK97 family phage prohead protease [Pseudomonadota bacterium]